MYREKTETGNKTHEEKGYTHVTHEFGPLYDEDCEILILGSVPSPKSREQGFYYGHPQNRFWRVMAAVLGEECPQTIPEKKEMMLRHHIALWDSIEECDIRGASDSSIRNVIPTKIPDLLKRTKINRIFTAGTTAHRYYQKYAYPVTGIEATRLPSTSPANAAASPEKLISAYRSILGENMKKDYTIRLERKEDHRVVETLVRDSFWNVYRPGCLEHFLLKNLRSDPDFVAGLDFVMEKDGQIIGQNIFVRAAITSDDGKIIPVLTMGPICVTPELKRKGYGKILLDASLKKAKALGFGAVLLEGNIAFYGKSGFTYAKEFGIRYNGLPADADTSFFLCKELIPGYLKDVTGNYSTPKGYFICTEDPEGFAAYEASFPYKEKQKLPGQLE